MDFEKYFTLFFIKYCLFNFFSRVIYLSSYVYSVSQERHGFNTFIYLFVIFGAVSREIIWKWRRYWDFYPENAMIINITIIISTRDDIFFFQ